MMTVKNVFYGVGVVVLLALAAVDLNGLCGVAV